MNLNPKSALNTRISTTVFLTLFTSAVRWTGLHFTHQRRDFFNNSAWILIWMICFQLMLQTMVYAFGFSFSLSLYSSSIDVLICHIYASMVGIIDLLTVAAKTSTKFQPKAKPKPKPKPKPKIQLEQKSESIPLRQFVEDVAAANNEFTGRIVEEQPGNDVNQISGNINDDWQSSFEKSQEVHGESFLTLESLNDFPPQSTIVTVNSPPCSNAPTGHVSIDGNLEKGPIEPDLSYNIDSCTNFESPAQLDPLTGEEAAIFNDNGDFQIGNLSGPKDAESSQFWESLDILSHSKTCSGPRVGKFKPKPKAQTRKPEQIVTSPDKDLASVQYEENVHSVSSQTNYMQNKDVPSFTEDDILGSASVRVTDSAPTETIFDFHVNEESMNLADQMDSVIPEEHLDAVTESPSAGPESVKKGKRKTRKGLNPTQLDNSPESSLENQVGTSSERLRRRSNKTLEPIDESDDEGIDDGFVHGNEDSGDYEPGSEYLDEKKGSKSKKPVNEKERPIRKRKKANEVPAESTKVAKKKFPHRTRRNKRQDLLKMTEDELEMHMHTVPMKELIRLAEHRERLAKKEASTSGTPARNQSASSFSNNYDEDEAFAQGTGSAYEHDYSMEAENATYYNYRTHMKITPRIKWSKQDTELFYEAIQQFGTDLSMIKECFPGRTREQIKAKYKKEERQQPLRLSDALTTRAKGHSQFEVVIERLKQAQAQDSENDDPTNLTGEEDEDVTATDINAGLDATKPVELQKEVETDTKFEDSEDEMDWSQYKSEV
ncbi:uncharacterized protein LOC112516570 isoform X2 [Cynara cardunculus var. scolymus]|uniref:uncharacterized protein LOC112516570 isoform X2 n=1 Tax=Cynara cardunculus var. scolymus TaxID=59895 RepID=UPI000D628EFE|nr:uncharacterized protein LOC112516570 isoform X2 [Cynara cardunculus var. scolymus]